MRALLHAPAFQALESAWRGVHWLISSLELDENLQLHLFDVTREELLADIVAAQGTLARDWPLSRAGSTAGATCRVARAGQHSSGCSTSVHRMPTSGCSRRWD